MHHDPAYLVLRISLPTLFQLQPVQGLLGLTLTLLWLPTSFQHFLAFGPQSAPGAS